MGLIFTVVYHKKVIQEDIPKITTAYKQRIKTAIESKLTTEPEIFGAPLRNSLKGYRKLRVGDYRVVFRIEKQQVKVFILAHRSIVYNCTRERL